MTCIFTKKDNKIQMGIRKVSVQKRPSKKSADKVSRMFYLPIHKDEARALRPKEDSFVKAEVALIVGLELSTEDESD